MPTLSLQHLKLQRTHALLCSNRIKGEWVSIIRLLIMTQNIGKKKKKMK